MNRTVQFFGQGYGISPAVIEVKMEDTVIFSGKVPTLNQASYNTSPEDQEVLFTCELPIEFDGLVPMHIQVIESTVVFAHVHVNHCFQPNGINQYYATRQGQDSRVNVKIDGVVQPPNLDFPGATVSWTIGPQSEFSYDLNVAHGTNP
jgi:hypothetical protein